MARPGHVEKSALPPVGLPPYPPLLSKGFPLSSMGIVTKEAEPVGLIDVEGVSSLVGIFVGEANVAGVG